MYCEYSSKHVQQTFLVQCAVNSAQPSSMYGKEILDSSGVIGFPGCAGIRQTGDSSGLDTYLGLFLAGTEYVFEV